MAKVEAPSVRKTAFTCPRCSALTTQFWNSALAVPNEETSRLPRVAEPGAKFDEQFPEIGDEKVADALKLHFEKLRSQRPFGEKVACNRQSHLGLHNVNFTKCYNCKEFAVWVGTELVYPVTGQAPEPNADLPKGVSAIYEEAAKISAISPRGAAALLRLCIQLLCKELGESGKDLNKDIASLVKKGLDPRVQKALDVVRVVGIHAVHPGTIVFDDNQEIADALFLLVNLVSEKMITEPKHIEEVYDSLPSEARDAIDKRDQAK